ncbi:MAG TPA: DoxX family protein [Candidatus Sulfotelmatobacter sp.]|nr:DoxX family protein [Candidatus Sulfotelmatobacter sp.]
MPGSNSSPAASFGLLLLRVGAGGMLAVNHGWTKLMHFSQLAPKWADPLHIGHDRSLMLTIFAEVGCAALVALGFATRFAAAILVFMFGMIVLVVLRGHPFSDRELAIVYALPFLCLVFTGGGGYALDANYGPKVKFGGK